MSLSDYSLRKPVTVWVLTAALLVLGIVSLVKLKLDFLPTMDAPFIGVFAPYLNAVPEQAEREIARPIEEIMATLGDVKEVFSDCNDQGVFVGVTFEFGRSVDVLRMEVKEKMEQVKPLLPSDLERYFLFTFNTNDIPILEGRISARGRDLAGSYDLLERRVIQPLQRIDGVGRVQVDGISPKQVSVYLRMNKIIEHKIDVEGVFRALNANNVDLSLGGVRDGSERLMVRALGQFRTLEEIEELPINTEGLRLGDIADVVYGEPAPSYRRHINGEPAVAFVVQKASGANTVEVSKRVNEVLAEIKKDPALEGVDILLFFDQAKQITGSLRGLLEAGIIGSLFSIGVLYLFLRRMKTTLLVSIAIPFSVIATCAFLYLTDRSLNLLTMSGLMLAVGMLVDDAIVVLESIYQRQQSGLGNHEAAAIGTREVAMAVTASTLTSVIVFAPVVLSKGEEMTAFLGSVGITLSVTLLFSLLVCLTLIPLFAARLSAMEPAPEFRFLARSRELYLRALRWTAFRHPHRTAFLLVPAFLALTVLLIKVTKFAPEIESERGIKKDFLRVELDLKDNANLYTVETFVLPAEQFVIAKKDSLGISSVYSVYEDNFAMMKLYFDPDRKYGEKEMKALRKFLRERLPVQAGVAYQFGDEQEVGRGAKKLAVTIFGEDGELLRDYAEEARRRLALLPGLQDLRAGSDDRREQVDVVLDRNAAGRYGVDPRSVAGILGLTFRGMGLREFESPEREVSMGILLEPSDRQNLENLRGLPVTMVDGRIIELGQVAHFEMSRTPGYIHREQQKTARTVSASYEGEDFKELTEKVTSQMNALGLPAGYSWSFGREMRDSEAQQSQFGMDILLALLCVYFVMAALFESFLHPLVIMAEIPFAAVGVVWTLILARSPLNIMSMIGIVILIGVVVKNGIVLIDHINTLRRRGLSRADAIVGGCRERYRPILMTAGTTVLGLVPMVVGDTDLGSMRYAPMAWALMGGMTSSTILTLLVLPTFYIIAEEASLRARATWGWGLGRGPLPWRAVPSGGTPVRLAPRGNPEL